MNPKVGLDYRKFILQPGGTLVSEDRFFYNLEIKKHSENLACTYGLRAVCVTDPVHLSKLAALTPQPD